MDTNVTKKNAGRIAGRISPTLMGDYDNTTSYRRLDWVYYGGTSYICRKNNTLGIPPTDDNARWQKIVEVPTELELEFDEAQERENISSGEKMHAILGKIMKYFSDLKGHAFLDPYNDLDETEPGKSLDAVQGKEIKDVLDAIVNIISVINPANTSEILNEILNNYSIFNKTSTCPFQIYIGHNCQINITDGNYIGFLIHDNGCITGTLINHWNQLITLSISISLYDIPYTIDIKEIYSVTDLQSQLQNTVNKSSVLNTKEQISANTSSNNIAGALALKEMNNSLDSKINQINSDLQRINLTNAVYIPPAQMTDELLDDIQYCIDHPAIFVHINALADIGIGYWHVVISSCCETFLIIVQIAIGDAGMAFRFRRGENTSGWVKL